MKHFTIALATESAVIASGLKVILSACSQFNIECRQIRPNDICSNINRIKPAAIIADMADPTVIVQISSLKNEMENIPAIIGFYFSAIPVSAPQIVDATITVYDNVEVIERTLNRTIHLEDTDTTPTDLTPREKEVVIGIVKGLSNKEIASDINVSVNTVMTHRRNIASKLRIHSPAGLTIYAIVSKLVTLEEIKDQIPSISDSQLQ